jgi:predicted RNA-binding Zn-ribbon protein involved in translation (DUF1610 family)
MDGRGISSHALDGSRLATQAVGGEEHEEDVMKCPSCGEQAIGFGEWARGHEAFKTNCRKCGVALKASAGTWLSLAIGLALILALVFGADAILGEMGRGARRFLVALPLALACGAVGWLVGGYRNA